MSQTMAENTIAQDAGLAGQGQESLAAASATAEANRTDPTAANLGADAADSASGDTIASTLAKKTLLRVKGLGRRSRAIGLRLRVGDIIVAVDGEVFHGNPGELSDRLLIEPPKDDEDYEDDNAVDRVERVVLTVSRGGVFFDVFTYGPLGGELDFVLPDESADVVAQFEKRPAPKLESLKAFEVYRDINRHCSMFEQSETMTAAMMPPLWLLERRMWEPLMATLSIYGLTFAIHPIVFAITFVLTALYFKRGQIAFQRSYAMFHERHMWMFIVAPSAYEAQVTCRMLDPKCSFEFSLIPPPKKKRASAA